MINIDNSNKDKCCGCTACINICPVNAIEMIPDEEGFLYPKVDKDKCVNCGLCDKVCPYNRKDEKDDFLKAFVVQNKNEEILNNCTSGGFFLPVASMVLEENGYVYGSVLDENLVVRHKEFSADNKGEVNECQGSKYVQSELGSIFRKIEKNLKEERLVCFSGTPCQVKGLKGYLGKEYENLITIDLVCRSVPSPLFFKKYIEYQQEKYSSQIKKLSFRSKIYGYHSGALTIDFKNGKKYSGSNRVDLYSRSFHSDITSRYSCYNCPAKGMYRCSDFTIFDSWNPSELNDEIKDNDKGYTNVFIHTEKGYKIFKEKISGKFDFYEINPFKAAQYTGGMIEKSIHKSDYRDKFYISLNENNFEKAISEFYKVSILEKMFEKSKKILYPIGILKFLKSIKK